MPDTVHLEQAGATSRWPGLTRSHAPATEVEPAVEEKDMTAWAIPYTDLTMLLMVFFIVKLSLMDPNPPRSAETPLRPEYPSGVATQVQRTGPASFAGVRDGQGDPVPVAGGAGLLPDDAGLLPRAQRVPPPSSGAQPPQDPWNTTEATVPPPQPEAAPDPREVVNREWALRILGLEKSTSAFLKDTGLAGQIDLTATATGIELRLPDEVLFPSGTAALRSSGADLMSRVAVLLKRIDGDIQIAGHTDNVPISTARFPSNWELSAARAIEVVRLLQALGVPEHRMEAVGHGDNRPIASNATAEGRATNRRVTIQISPPLLSP